MAEPKSNPTQVAREALNRLDLLSKDVESLQTELEKADISTLKQRVAVIEEKVVELKKSKDEFDKLSRQAAVLEDRVNELKKANEESGKRGWQFVFIAAGAGLALLSSFLVQLVFYFIKK